MPDKMPEKNCKDLQIGLSHPVKFLTPKQKHNADVKSVGRLVINKREL